MQYPKDCLIDVPLNDNSCLTPSYHHSPCSSLKNNTQMARTCPSEDTHSNSSLDHQDPCKLFHNNAFGNYYIYAWRNPQHSIILILHLPTIMNVTNYWPVAREYSIWNAIVAALQLWTADLEAHVLSTTTEQVYNAFFYSTSTHLLCQQSDEILFGCFVTTLNTAFESKLTLEDGYESGSENFNIPTPLRRTPKIHHVSSDENISFDPVTPCSTGTSQSHHKPVWHCLTFSSSDDEDTLPVNNSLPSSIAPLQQLHSKYTLQICDDLDDDEEKEEDFQTVSLEDDHWTMEEILDSHLCINKHSIPHELCPYPCPYLDYTSSLYYDTLDISDISEFEYLMTTCSDEDIPTLEEEIGYWSL